MTKNTYEVYVCKLGNEVLYVGQGLCGRHEHCTSGVSHVYGLNRLHFTGAVVDVSVVHSGLDKETALQEETALIQELKPTLNKVGYNFNVLASRYYEITCSLQHYPNSVELLSEIQDILKVEPELKLFVETIGIEAIKATHFHKTKTRVKYQKYIGEHEETKKAAEALKSVKLKQNNFYSFKELKDLVKAAYDKHNLNCAAKATDVQSVYSVKSTSRNGVRGYLVIGKI